MQSTIETSTIETSIGGSTIVESTTESLIDFLKRKTSVDNPEFDELRPSFMALGIIMSIIIIVGNSFVLLLFYQERRSLKIAHKYIISMACCDLGMGLLSVPTQVYMMNKKISASSSDCPWILGVITALVQTSLTVLVASSADRYWAVRFPHHYRRHAKNWLANCIIIASWIIPCSFGLSHFLTAKEASWKTALCFMAQETYNDFLIKFLVYFVMPLNLTIIVILYYLIHREMTKLFDTQNFYSEVWKIMFQKHNAEKLKKIGTMKVREVRMTFLLMITVALAFITFIPGTTIGYILIYEPQLMEVKPLLICYLLLSVNSVFNPFIYAFNIRNVRAQGKRLLARLFRCQQDENIEMDITTSSGTALETSQSNMNRISVFIANVLRPKGSDKNLSHSQTHSQTHSQAHSIA